MIKKLILLLLINQSFLLLAQKMQTESPIIAQVELNKLISTGKRHNSFFFIFKIKKILSGEIQDSMLISEEIFSDFGGKFILNKIYPDTYESPTDTQKKDEVVIKFSLIETDISKPDLSNNAIKCKLIWVAEKDRWQSFYRLEEFLMKYLENSKFSESVNMLTEHNGKLFFSKNGKDKIAVEAWGSGSWAIADIEKWSY